MEKYLTWRDLVEKESKTPEERVLIQCIASLMLHPDYRTATPDEIYGGQVEYAKMVLRSKGGVDDKV